MNEYETEILIKELQKLIVAKTFENSMLETRIEDLRTEVERLEHLLTPKAS